jgi:hypothetical protein
MHSIVLRYSVLRHLVNQSFIVIDIFCLFDIDKFYVIHTVNCR